MSENPFIDLIDQKVAAEQTAGGTSPANPFVPLIDENEQSKSVAFRAAMTEAKDTEPDAYAKQVELAKRTGIPVETVARNTDKVNREAPFLSGEYEELIQTSPNTVRFLSEEDNAKYAKDDIPQLTVMEEIAKMSAPKSLAKDLGRSFMSGVSSMNAGIAQTPALIYNAGAAAYNVAAIPQNFVADKLNIPGLKAPEQGTAPDWLLNNPVATYYKKAAEYYAPEELSQDPIQLMREGNGKQAARAIAAQVVANLPQQAFLVASTLAGQPQIGLASMGVLSASHATAEAQENGKSAIQATLDALAQGSIEVATEQFGTVGIVKHWETALAKSFGKGTAKQIIADAGRSIAASFFGEGTEEFAAQIGQDFSDYATGNDRALDGTLQRAMNAFLIGGFSGATVSSPAVLTAATIKSQRANQDGAFWDRMLGVSAESKLRQRSPAKYEAFVDNLLKDKAANTGTDVDGRFIYVSQDALKTFFQTPEGKPDEAAFNKFIEEMEVKDQLADAAAAGKEFELSAAKFAAKFAGSDLSQAIRADIRFSPDGMTQREQANLQAEYQKMVTEMQQSYSELVDTQKMPAQVEVMRDKLLLPKDKGGMGMAAEDADAQLSVFMAGMNTFARKSGLPLEEYVRRVNPVLNIGGEAVNLAPAVQKPVDPNSTKKAKPIDYTDPKNVAYRDAIAAAGGEFIGTQPGFTKKSTGETTEGLVMFNDPVTGTTLALKPSLLTPENIAAKITAAKASFNGNKLYQNGGIPDELNYLAEEAKPFNSAEEFVSNKLQTLRAQFQRPEEIARNIETLRANGIEVSGPDDVVTMYHGTSGRGMKGIQANGLNVNSYLASDKKASDLFAGKRGGVIELKIPVRDLGFVSGSTMAGTSGVTAVTAMKLRQDEAGLWRMSVTENAKDEIPGIGLPPGINADKFFKEVKSAPDLNSPEFKAWFKDSKVTKDGKPQIVYHGTSKNFTKFSKTKTPGGITWFSSDRESIEAGEAGAAGRSVIMQLYASIQKPAGWEEYNKYGLGQLENMGYDGVILPRENGQFDGFVLEPTQLKDAKRNNGKFDPNDASILRQGPQGSVQFTDTATLINLYQSANFSTFLHESGHIFMNEMAKLVNAKVADPQTVADYETLKTFVGGDIKTVEAQEKLARAFEAYLREGKAPSVKLVDAFQRFRDWLTAIYKAIAGLNVEINDEVRGVFDRLLASQNEVDEAQQFYRAKKVLMDLMPVTPEQRAKGTAAKKDSDEAALAKSVKERLGIYLRVQGGKQAIREQATKDIDALPVYKAIKSGIDQNGIDAEIFKANYGEAALKLVRLNHPNFARTKAKAKKGRSYHAEVLARGGINPDSMGEIERKYFKEHGLFGLFRKDGRGLDDLAASLMDEGLLQVPDDKNPDDHLKALLEGKKSIPDSAPFIPEEAVTLGELAVENDFRSEQDLAQSVLKADRRSRAITKRSKELLAAKEADLIKDLKSEERVPGEEAIHNDKSLTFLITEAELLADKIAEATKRRPERIEEKLYRNAAEEIISKKSVRQATRYDLYARAEQRFARQSEDALLNGDYTNALILKKKQLLNHALVQSAIRARDEKLKIENFFKSKNYKGKLANVENDFAQASLDLTSTYKLGTGDLVPTAANALDRIRTADEFLFSAIPEWIVNKQIPKNFEDYRDLSMAQLRELNDAIRSILQYGNDEMKSIEEGEAKTLQEWVDDSVAEMQKLKDIDTKRRDESSKLSKPLELIDAFASGASLVQFTSDWMDNFSFMKTGNAGPFKRLYNKVLQAEVKYTDLKTEVVKDAKKAWDTLGKSATRIAETQGSHFEIPGVPLTEDMRRTKRSMWTVNRMVALLLNTGNAGNLSALQRSYGYTEQQLQTVASYFTAAELEAIQDIWNATDLLFPRLDETHFSIYNRHLPKVDPLPVTYQSMDGKQVALKGGYYPLVFDHKINDVAAANMEEDLMKNQTAAVIRSTKPTDGFTFSRVSGHSLPPVLETYVWFNHINATARYISHARILRDLNRFTRDKTWAKEFKKKAGDDHYKNIRGWLQYNANPSRRLLVSKLDLMADWLKSLSTAAVLGFKTATGLKQRTALINAAQAIGKDKIANGWQWILKAYREVDLRTSGLGLSQSDTWASILKKSPYLKTREGNIDRELSDLRRGIDPLQKKWKIAGKEFTVRDLQDFAFEWIKMNDRATVAIVWTASYNQYVQEKSVKGATPEAVQKAAAAYADGIVQDTQASSLTPELSTLQRQEGWLRLFTSFMTSSINYGNRIMQNHRAWKAGAISNKEFFNHVLHENIAMPYAAFLITQCLRGGSDEPPEWWEWLMVPFEAAASFIPIIRDVFAYFQYGKEIGETPVLEPVARTAKALKTTGKFIVGDADFTQAAWDIGRAIEVYLKVPALNIVKDITGAYENLTE